MTCTERRRILHSIRTDVHNKAMSKLKQQLHETQRNKMHCWRLTFQKWHAVGACTNRS